MSLDEARARYNAWTKAKRERDRDEAARLKRAAGMAMNLGKKPALSPKVAETLGITRKPKRPSTEERLREALLDPNWCTVTEALEILGIHSPSTISRLIARGRLRILRIGKHALINREDATTHATNAKDELRAIRREYASRAREKLAEKRAAAGEEVTK